MKLLLKLGLIASLLMTSSFAEKVYKLKMATTCENFD